MTVAPASSPLAFVSSRLMLIAAAKVTTLLVLAWWRRRQTRCDKADEKEYQELLAKVPPKSIFEFEKAAKLHPLAKVYFQYFSDQAVTAAACRSFFNSIRLLPSILQGDLTRIDTSLEIFGQSLSMPVLVAPSAFHCFACPEGEVATARGAGQAGVGYCYNWMLSSKDYRQVVKEEGVKWLHLYMFEERELVEASLRTAQAAGAFSAVILTCDHPHTRVQGRMVPYFAQGTIPPHVSLDDPFFPNQAALGFDDTTWREISNPEIGGAASTDPPPGGTNSSKLSWNDVKWIKSLTNLPVIAKGILSASDARAAVEAGVDGIVVSNHGGRQCDFAVSAVEALLTVVQAVRQSSGSNIPVLVDSGVRTSADIIRARCMGATAVLLGRPPLWALACEGSVGLERMLTTLKQDLKDDLRSLGVRSIHELSMQHVWPPDRHRLEQIVQLCEKRPSEMS